jgi:hypothetical protein
MWFVDLFEGEKLSPNVGAQVLERLESSPSKAA